MAPIEPATIQRLHNLAASFEKGRPIHNDTTFEEVLPETDDEAIKLDGNGSVDGSSINSPDASSFASKKLVG